MSKKQFFEGISRPRNATLMRIFLNMGFMEHTGHGIPTIVNKYGPDIFEIEKDYLRCTIAFDKKVFGQLEKKNVGLNENEKQVLDCLSENPNFTAEELVAKINVTKRTVERIFSSLQAKGLIKRVGSKRTEAWLIIDQ